MNEIKKYLFNEVLQLQNFKQPQNHTAFKCVCGFNLNNLHLITLNLITLNFGNYLDNFSIFYYYFPFSSKRKTINATSEDDLTVV